MTEQKELAENQHDTPEAETDEQYGSMFTDAELEELRLTDRENQPDYDPEEPTPEQKAEAEKQAAELAKAERLEAAYNTAFEALGYYETGIQLGAHRRYVLPDSLRQQAAANIAPAIVKHLPDGFDLKEALFGRYKEEISLIIGLYMLGSSTIASIKELKAEDAERARIEQAKKKAANDDEQQKEVA